MGLRIFHNETKHRLVCGFCNTVIWNELVFVGEDGQLICSHCLAGGIDKRHPEYENPDRVDYETEWYT